MVKHDYPAYKIAAGTGDEAWRDHVFDVEGEINMKGIESKKKKDEGRLEEGWRKMKEDGKMKAGRRIWEWWRKEMEKNERKRNGIYSYCKVIPRLYQWNLLTRTIC